MNGFETITRLGGYILIFSLVFTCIRHYWPFSEQTSILFTSPIELTTGLQQIAHSRYSWRFRCISSITLTAFGGLCVMFQTKSVLENRLITVSLCYIQMSEYIPGFPVLSSLRYRLTVHPHHYHWKHCLRPGKYWKLQLPVQSVAQVPVGYGLQLQDNSAVHR